MDFDFFAALRRMKAAAPDAPAAEPLLPSTPPAGPSPQPPLRVRAAGLALIKHFESCARRRPDGQFEAYPDPASSLSRTGSGSGDPWTIGWGATGPGIARGTVWSQAQCDARLEHDLARCAAEVARALGPCPTSPAQFDALVSFHYNTGAIARATLTRLHKASRFAEAAAQFGKWVNGGGKRLPGLVRRRAAETALYSTG